MQTSLFLARLLGPMFALVGLALLLEPQRFCALLRAFIESPVLVYLAGFLGLLGGLALVLAHNLWSLDWRLLVTLVGWLALVRAVVAILRPQWIVSIGSRLLDRPAVFVAAGAIDLAIGLVLSYVGYAA